MGVKHYGKAITSDEAVEHLMEAEEKKKLAKKGKKQTSRAKMSLPRRVQQLQSSKMKIIARNVEKSLKRVKRTYV